MATLRATYMTPAEFAQKHGTSDGYVRSLLREGRIPGARRVLRRWLIPIDADVSKLFRNTHSVEIPEGYCSVTQIARVWGCSSERVRQLCVEGRIDGAEQVTGGWLVPVGTERPIDRRKVTPDVG